MLIFILKSNSFKTNSNQMRTDFHSHPHDTQTSSSHIIIFKGMLKIGKLANFLNCGSLYVYVQNKENFWKCLRS